MSSSNCNFSLLSLMEGEKKTALNSSMAFSDMVWVTVHLEENGDHGGPSLTEKVAGSYTHVLFGSPKENQMKGKKKKKCPSMIPIKNQPFCCLKTFSFEVHQFLDVVWKLQQGHESFQCKNSQGFDI